MPRLRLELGHIRGTLLSHCPMRFPRGLKDSELVPNPPACVHEQYRRTTRKCSLRTSPGIIVARVSVSMPACARWPERDVVGVRPVWMLFVEAATRADNSAQASAPLGRSSRHAYAPVRSGSSCRLRRHAALFGLASSGSAHSCRQ